MKVKKVKQVLSRVGYQWERRGQNETVKESEYGRCILCLCIKIEQ
jgi:hypothetical protein